MRALIALILFITLFGCAGIDWDNRVGQYTYDEAVKEYGPPDNSSKLTNGNMVYSWVTGQGSNWTDKLILTFTPEGKLIIVIKNKQ